VEAIARGCLCNLHPPNCGIAAQYELQVWSGCQSILQSSGLYPKTIPRDLYHGLQRAPAQANRGHGSSETLVANDASFGRFSIFHYDDKRNQTSIGEVGKFQLSTRLVNDQMVGQADVFEMRAK
jgi:hypothetical protein